MSVTRQAIIDEAQSLVDTLRARGETHGQGAINFEIMAQILNLCGYRRIGLTTTSQHQLDALDTCEIYLISKLARIAAGDREEIDHYADTAGYGVIAAAIAREKRRARAKPG